MQDIDALMNIGRPPEGDRKPEGQVPVLEPKPKKMTEVERLEQQRERQKEKAKKTTEKLNKAKRAQRKKAEDAAKKKRQDKAEAILAFCENTEVTITIMENGQKRTLQLYDYIVWEMGNEGKALP